MAIDIPAIYSVRLRGPCLVERFWAQVDKGDSCWEFTGAKQPTGYPYGRLSLLRRTVLAHRVSWEIANGRAVPLGMCVCHTCDNPVCVRPDHLFIGTAKDNKQDSLRKGRVVVPSTQRGERHHRSKFGADTAREIFRRVRAGERAGALAREFDVDPSVISNIKLRKAWRDATEAIS